MTVIPLFGVIKVCFLSASALLYYTATSTIACFYVFSLNYTQSSMKYPIKRIFLSSVNMQRLLSLISLISQTQVLIKINPELCGKCNAEIK